MATLTNTKIKDTYVGLLKTTDNQAIDASGVTLVEDGAGNASALSVGRSGNGVTVTGTITGNLSGNVTGNLTGTVLTAAQTNITSVGTLSSLAVSGDLTVDSTTLKVDSALNRVGINTAIASATIHVNSATTDSVALFESSDSTAKIHLKDDSTSNIYSVGIGAVGNDLTFYAAAGGNERMRIDSSGNVGIGTSSPAEKLSIENGYITIKDNAYDEYFLSKTRSDGSQLVGFQSHSLGAISIHANGGEKMRIDRDGNVGIGTSSPDAVLEVDGSSYDDGILITTPLSGSIYNAKLEFRRDLTSGGAKIQTERNPSGGVGLSFNYTANNTAEVAGTYSEAMRIDSSGRVGIGTSSPTELIHAYNASGNAFAKVQSLTGGTAGLKLQAAAGESIIYAGAGGLRALTFHPAGSEVVRINSNGLSFNGDTAAANALDDYEEGTWTPAITFGGSAVGVTYAFSGGRYTKIGRQVTVNGLLQLSNKGTSTGNVSILGLPFTIATGSDNYSAVSLRLDGVSFANAFMGLGIVNTTSIYIEEITEAGILSRLTHAEFTNASSIAFSLTYFV